MKRRALRVGLVVLLGLLGLYAWASVDRCGAWPPKAPALTQLAHARGALRVGAARVEFPLTFPTLAGGYPPPRATVSRATAPLAARALVLEVGNQRLRLVLLDTLLVPPQLRDAILTNLTPPVWVLATHTHSGPAGYDPRLAAEWAALGGYDDAQLQLISTAARSALQQAEAKLEPAQLEVGEGQQRLAMPRSGDQADTRLTRVRLDGASGPLAQVLVLSGHPTLTARPPDALDPDWPGHLAARFERDGGPITLVLQGAGGNASVDRAQASTPEAAAEQLEPVVRAVLTQPQPLELDAAWNEVRVALPHPDGQRLAPGLFTAAVENALCDEAEDVAFLHGLSLGELKLLFTPVEPSLTAGLVLEEQARVGRVVSLADGYAGYVETEAAARRGEGEAKRQYFPPDFLRQLADGARLAGEALERPKAVK